MRKAFDANVPKLRPRLRSAASALEGSEGEASVTVLEAEPPPEVLRDAGAEPFAAGGSDGATARPFEDVSESSLEPADVPPPLFPRATALAPEARHEGLGTGEGAAPRAASASPAAESPAEASDVQARRERLESVKRRVAAAARPAPSMPALPESPARAGESALTLVRELEGQLQRSRGVEEALRADLDAARTELTRGAAEGRRGAERLAAVEAQVEEKRAVLADMLAEMTALEEERDGAVARAQALTALDEERQALLDSLSARAEAAEKARAEADSELARLGEELDERAADAARLRSALAQVTHERDDLAREAAKARRERDELGEARKALEQVHEALATARSRLA